MMPDRQKLVVGTYCIAGMSTTDGSRRHVAPSRPAPAAKMAVISRYGKGNVCNLRVVDLDSCSSFPKPIDGAANLHYVPNCTIKIPVEDYYSDAVKTGFKHQTSVKRILEFLSGGAVDKESTNNLKVGNSMVVERVEQLDRADHKSLKGEDPEKLVVNYKHFVETSFTPKGSRSAISEIPHYLHVRRMNTGSFKLGANSKVSMSDIGSIHIVTGMCLFAYLHLGSEGIKSPPLPENRMPTNYVIDGLVRLPNVVADIVSILPPHIPTTITLDIPRVQYYTSLLDMYEVHRSPGDLDSLRAWFRVIDERYRQISSVMSRAIKHSLQRRGVEGHRVSINCSSGMGELIPEIKSILDNFARAPTVQEFLDLLKESDPLWAPFYDCVAQPATTLKQIAALSYCFQLVRPIFQSAQKSTSEATTDGRQLLVQIDNAGEQKILTSAQNILKEFHRRYLSAGVVRNQPPWMVGIYSFHGICEDGKNDPMIYLNDCGHCIIEKDGVRIHPTEIVAEIYRRETTQTVLQLMIEENMFTHSTSSSDKHRQGCKFTHQTPTKIDVSPRLSIHL